jgi:glutathione S-transferase
MKFYNSVGPNPRVVRMFMAERGIEVPRVEVDLRGGENRQVLYTAKNPAGQLPCLELDDGTVLAEITAICEYLDETAPPGGPTLIGATPLERAECRMWTRRVDLNVAEPLANGYRFGEGFKFFEKRFRCIPEASAGLKQIVQDKLRWLDGLMAGRAFLCGERLTLADILLFCFLDFGSKVGQPLDPALGNVVAHHTRMAARPSAAA